MSDDPRLARYEKLQQHIEAAGFHWTFMPTLDDDDNECGPPRFICASIRFPGGLSGNSFWVLNRESQWFCGTWGGLCYRIPFAQQVGEMCVAWMIHNPDKTVSDFDDIIKERFNLVPVTFDEIDSVPE